MALRGCPAWDSAGSRATAGTLSGGGSSGSLLAETTSSQPPCRLYNALARDGPRPERLLIFIEDDHEINELAALAPVWFGLFRVPLERSPLFASSFASSRAQLYQAAAKLRPRCAIAVRFVGTGKRLATRGQAPTLGCSRPNLAVHLDETDQAEVAIALDEVALYFLHARHLQHVARHLAGGMVVNLAQEFSDHRDE